MCTHNLCFGAKIRKIDIPLHTPVSLYKSGALHGHVFLMIQNFKPLTIFYAFTAWFMSDLFGNHIVCFLMTWLKSRRLCYTRKICVDLNVGFPMIWLKLYHFCKMSHGVRKPTILVSDHVRQKKTVRPIKE